MCRTKGVSYVIYDILTRVRQQKPLVHHITNWVTIYDCANITRMIGALPVMAHAKEESPDMAAIASSLVLNIGTLTPELVESMILAGKSANSRKIPVVLDAVGVGAKSSIRLLSTLSRVTPPKSHGLPGKMCQHAASKRPTSLVTG